MKFLDFYNIQHSNILKNNFGGGNIYEHEF